MKKLLISLLLAVVTVVCVAGCGSTSGAELPNKVNYGEWVEVQNITYYLNSENDTNVSNEFKLKSTCYFDGESERISQSEYENASAEQKIYLPSENIDVNRKDYFAKIDEIVGKTFYYVSNYGYNYNKGKINSYEPRYVRVRFYDDNSLEINYYETLNNQGYTTIKVLPLSYAITYFSN